MYLLIIWMFWLDFLTNEISDKELLYIILLFMDYNNIKN